MHHPRQREPKRAGFTLVEMLVTVGIVSTLIVLGFSAFGGAKAGMQSTGCIRNLKQLSTGLMLYAQDHDNRLPQAWYKGNGGFLWYFSADFNSYLGPQGFSRLSLGMCPAWNGTRKNGIPGDVVWVPNTYDSYTLGYPVVSSNRYLSTPLLTQYSHPATTLLICDGAPQTGYPYAADVQLPYERTTAAFMAAHNNEIYTAFRHGGKINVVFADLHISALAPNEVTEAMLNP